MTSLSSSSSESLMLMISCSLAVIAVFILANNSGHVNREQAIYTVPRSDHMCQETSELERCWCNIFR